MNSSTTQPNPAVMASRNDIEKTLTSRLRLRAIVDAHDLQLRAGGADPDHVGALERRLARNLLLVHERAIAAEVTEPELAVAHHELAVLPRHSVRLIRDDDRAAALDELSPHEDAARADRIGDAV